MPTRKASEAHKRGRRRFLKTAALGAGGLALHPSNFSCFWSTATGWGTFSQKLRNGTTALSLSVAHGELACRSVHVGSAEDSGRQFRRHPGKPAYRNRRKAGSGESAFLFDPNLVVRPGISLSLTARA